MEITLDVQPRTETGKGPARRARAAGKVPAVFYGPSAAPQPVYVDAREMSHALHTVAGANVLITLKLNGESHLAVPREIQRHPIRGTLVHVDFVNVARNVKITADVPLQLVGESAGVKAGGQLDQHTHTVTIEALPAEIPPAIEVDISGLEIGETLTVADVKAPAGVEILSHAEDLVVAVHTEVVLEVEAPEEAEEEEAEEAATEAPAGEAETAETAETPEG